MFAPSGYCLGMTLIAATIETPLCTMHAATTDTGICLLEMGSPERQSREQEELELAFDEPMIQGTHPLLTQLSAELDAYFAGDLREFNVPLNTPGTEWQQRVWGALVSIPFGETVSYGELATRLSNPGGSRAVGLANGKNRVSIIIPCHRVIAADGTLHGYGGGIKRKRWLLDHEQLHAGAGLFAQ
jgi:AraC family transcriptional regulator of adaptative response/methylated-DNA-[protein]-cysteine methyltransferase